MLNYRAIANKLAIENEGLIFTRVPKFGETWDDLLPCNIKM